MLTTPPSRRAVQGATFALWALAAASAVYWGFRLAVRSSAGPIAPVAVRAPAIPDPLAIARLLGSNPAIVAAPVSIASRFSLVGLIARPSRSGVALISVDGKPAKPYRVGSAVDEGLILQGVEPRRALLGPQAQGPATVTLELPLPRRDTHVDVPVIVSPPSRGMLPSQMQPVPLPLQRPNVIAPNVATPNQRPGMPSAAPR